MSNFGRNLIFKVYQEDGTFIETLDDVISSLSIERSINGGDGDFTFELARKMDDFDEDTSIKFNNRVKVYLKDSYNIAGTKLVAYGYIVSYNPYLIGKKEGVEVTCLSAVSKLSNDFYRSGTDLAASDLGVELTTQRADEMMTAIVTHYRSVETNSMINSPAGLTATTDNSGSPISFDHRFFNMKHLDALREASKFFPRNKEGGYWFYWRVSTDGDLIVKNISTTADHTFLVSKHIKEISGEKTIEGLVNRVYFWNEKGTVDPDYLKLTTDDSTSQTNYDVIAEYITDSKITNPSAAGLLSESKVYDKKDPKVKVRVTLNGKYDLASIVPGETCQILNLKNNPFKFGSDTVLVIHSIRYEVDQAVLELSRAADDFEDIVENERQRLDKEMTWYGYITQQLTAAQLGPADRTWTTDITFAATSGGDAYRQVDWTAGIVYLPTSSGASAGRRVIAAGNTGLMSASTDYYIYLDEETFNTSAANEDTGTGTMKQGGDSLLDAGKSWSNDQYKGYIITIGGQTKIIKSNTATVLSIEDRWTISDTVGAYTIKKMSFDVSSNKETVSVLTKVVFSNVRANDSSDSEAVIIPTTGQSINIDGSQIAKDSITVDEIYSGYIYAGTIDADQINVGILTGFLIRTASSGLRMKLHYVAGDFAGYLDFLNDSTLLARFSSVLLFPGGGGIELELIEANSVSGETNELSIMWSGNSSYPGNAWFRLRNKYCGLYYNNATGTTTFYNDAKFANDIVPDTATLDIGDVSNDWRDIYLSGTIRAAYLNLANSLCMNSSSSTDKLYPEYSNTIDLGKSGNNWSYLYVNYCANHFRPTATTKNLGDASYYWNEVFYKTLTKCGGFGFLDRGVKLQDGKTVSDLEAVLQLTEDTNKKTPYGTSIINQRSLPDIVYKPARHTETGELLPRDKDGRPYQYVINDKTKKKEKVFAEDGEDVNAMISILIGAIKDLDKKIVG